MQNSGYFQDENPRNTAKYEGIIAKLEKQKRDLIESAENMFNYVQHSQTCNHSTYFKGHDECTCGFDEMKKRHKELMMHLK